MNTALRSDERVTEVAEKTWIIEISDLNSDNSLGYKLTGDYLMISIRSPYQEKNIAVHSLPAEEWHQHSIPVNIPEIELKKSSYILFKGVKRLQKKWKLSFIDRRIGIERSIYSGELLHIEPIKNRRKPKLVVEGYSFIENKNKNDVVFELNLKNIKH